MKLSLALEQYRTLKQSLGFRFRADAAILKAFGQALGEISLEQVQPAAARAYLDGPGPVTRFWERKWVTLRGFYRFALARHWVESSPLPAVAPKMPTAFVPYVYSPEELGRLLAAVPEPAVAGLSALTFRTLLVLLYGAGLRISEALRLEEPEVDLKAGLLLIRESKFFKSRWVPLGPRLTQKLSDYHAQRPGLPDPAGCWFFQDLHGEPVKRSTAERAFRRVRELAQIKRPASARYQPRLHDLRHAFAVHCLTHWYRQGAEVQRLLPQLATYLGHVDVAATQRYLTLTPELYQQASQRFERYAFAGGTYDQ